MDIVTAITGASGALYAQRFIQGLVAAGVNTHLVVSPLGRRLLHDELGMETVDLPALAGTSDHGVTLYNYNDVGSKLASGSFLHELGRRGLGKRDIVSNINWFMNVPVEADGALGIVDGISAPPSSTVQVTSHCAARLTARRARGCGWASGRSRCTGC